MDWICHYQWLSRKCYETRNLVDEVGNFAALTRNKPIAALLFPKPSQLTNCKEWAKLEICQALPKAAARSTEVSSFHN
jgi:hypothetical protein